ncbi:hypothetical protein [Chitinophaga sp. MM2321]|uniref:hypothetical protein n=1 Tax=Chitinophaga sp. MM2321 TaxID=3137178 RepID=UPI0032D596BA
MKNNGAHRMGDHIMKTSSQCVVGSSYNVNGHIMGKNPCKEENMTTFHDYVLSTLKVAFKM